LAALAQSLGVPMTWFDAFGRTPQNVQGRIETSGVLDDITERRKQARRVTGTFQRISLSPEWGSSGIWVDNGPSGWGALLDHELLDVPFALLRDIVRWHDRYDAWPVHQERPHGFCEAFEEEEKALAVRLADALGPGVQVERL
jgi:hypothetical protein